LVARRRITFIIVLLVIEFLDELVYGAREAAWPLLRSDLRLSYAQVGVLLGLPGIVSGVLEPLFGVLGDVGRRRALILGGGVAFAAALLVSAVSPSYGWLLLGFVVLSPASGAFVSLSQATLMDLAPSSRERNMARWTLAGSLGVVLGPLALALALTLSGGWRSTFFVGAGLAAVLVASAARFPFDNNERSAAALVELWGGLGEALRTLGRGEVLRWLILLRFSDLMLDVLLGYLALYLVDVVGVDPAQASASVAVWTGFGLLGDFLLIHLLKRLSGLRYLRWSAVAELVLFAGLLLIASFPVKLLLLALLGLLNAGWYAILKARLYATLPGRSGTVLAVDNIFGLFGAVLPWGVGLAAGRFGLASAMWVLALGPIALLIGLPRQGRVREVTDAVG
jgi:FSR family fosmidomycin resistance protein-like MFS transporter